MSTKKNVVSVSELEAPKWITVDVNKGPEQLVYKNVGNVKILARMFFTPEIAQWCLDHKALNRKLHKNDMNKYTTDMENGEWHAITGNSNICFDKEGRLADGQHRLNAIVKSGISTELYVELNTDFMGSIDNGAKRNTKDSLDIDGCAKLFENRRGGELYHYVARNILNILNATSFWHSAPVTDGVKTSAKITNATYKNFIIDNCESIGEAMDKCGGVLFNGETEFYFYDERFKEKQIVAYAWYLHNVCGYEFDTINEFFRQLLAMNKRDCKSPIINKVRTICIKDSHKEKGYYSVCYIDFLVRRCWNAWIMNDMDMLDLETYPPTLFDKSVVSFTAIKKIKFVHFIGKPQADAMNK